MSDSDERRAQQRLLTEALVRPEHHRQYHTNAHFKAAIDTLVGMLPYWVEGISAQCDREKADRDLQYTKLMTEMFTSTPQQDPFLRSWDAKYFKSKDD